MTYAQKLILLFAIVLFGGGHVYAQNWSKFINKVDESYRIGDYAKAAKHNKKYRKKVEKKLGTSNSELITYYLKQARNKLSEGFLIEFRSNLDLAVEMSQAVNSSSATAHSTILLEASELLTRNGSFNQALSYTNNAMALVGKGDDPAVKARLDLNYATIYSGQGFYSKALSLINLHTDYFAARAVDRETYVDEGNGKLKTRRLDELEVAERFDQYARILNLKSATLRFQGNFISADSAYMASAQWIGKNLSKSNIRFIESKLGLAQMLYEYGSTAKDPQKDIEYSLSQIKKNHKQSHYLAQDLYEVLLKLYLADESMGKYRNLASEHQRVIKKYFSPESIHYVKIEAVDLERKLNKDRVKELEQKSSNLLHSPSIPPFHAQRVKLLEFLYDLSIYQEQYSKAEDYLLDIMEVKKVLYGENSVSYHLTKVELANYYLDFTSKIEEAGKIYQESYQEIIKSEIAPGHLKNVNLLNHLALYYEQSDKYDLASEVLDEALLATRMIYSNEDREYGVELDKIANLELKIGRYNVAEARINEALDILSTRALDRENYILNVKALETQAKLNAIKGDFGEAENGIDKAQKRLKKALDLTGYDEVASGVNLAEVYIKFGKYKKTEELLNNAIDRYSVLFGDSSRNLIVPLLNLSQLKLTSGDYTEAEKIARKASIIARKVYGEESTKTAACDKLMSTIYSAIGDYERAGELIKNAIGVQQKWFGDTHIDFAKSLSQLGLIRFHNNAPANEIEPLFDEALAIVDANLGSSSPLYADMLEDLSILYISQNRHSEAFASLEKAQGIWEESIGRKNNINAANIYILTGDIYYAQRNFDLAEEHYDKAKRLFEKFFNENHPEYVRVMSKLSKVYYMENNPEKALKTLEEVLENYDQYIADYFPALSEREKAKYWNQIQPDYEFFNTVAHQNNESNPTLVEKVFNNALKTKAILLSSSLKIRSRILNSGDQDLIDKYSSWVEQKEFLTTIMSMGVDQLVENEIDPGVIQREVELLEKQISEKSEDFRNEADKDAVTWDQVQSALDPDEMAIEMIRYRHFDHIFSDSVIYAGLFLKAPDVKKKPGLFLIKNGKELETRYFKGYRNSIIFKVVDRYSYANYWKPIEDVIGATSTVYLSADGVFNQVNLEAIPTEDGQFVIDQSNIVLVSNTKDIYLSKHKKIVAGTANSAQMFGNPEYYSSSSGSHNVGQLPGTEKEITELTRLLIDNDWATDTYLQGQAREEQVKEVDNPKVFHIATHGFFTPEEETNNLLISSDDDLKAVKNPLLRTGLLLSGAGDLLDKTDHNYNLESGILTAYEAMSLNLDQTDLVVLSACETGLGDLTVGEGVYGLQRAFIVAGAQTLIMSMFKVNDEATQKLMVNFYKKWLETGNKRESFVAAKKELRNDFAEPIYWAAFIMIGVD